DVQISLDKLGPQYAARVDRQRQDVAGGDQAAVLFWGDQLHWVEIVLVGEDHEPIPGERYWLKLPDGTIKQGELDSDCPARFEAIRSGRCEVAFPDLDEKAWEPI